MRIKPGDEITADFLNYLLDLGEAAGLSFDGSSGLAGYLGGSGTAFHSAAPKPRWARVVSGGTGGLYVVREQVPVGVGAWEDGVEFEAREPNGASDLASGVPFVRCTYNVAWDEWTFEQTRC